MGDISPVWLALIPLSMVVLTVVAAMWERRPIQPYYVPEPGAEYAPGPEHQQANEQIDQIGYQHVTVCHDGKGRLYRVRYDFWTAPDNMTLAVIGSGTVASIRVFGIWIYSRTADGRTLLTTNERGEQDISGVEDQQTWHAMPLPELVEKHRQRLLGLANQPFSADSALLEYFDIRRRKAAALVARGYAKYVDDQGLVWRYTFKGAIVFYVTGVIVRPLRRLLRSMQLVRD
jgi:hypothetical protein